MTECQGCGAWNDSSRALCVLCGTHLAATDEWDPATDPPPLPPLPDGGLAASMPPWLREPPLAVTAAPLPPVVATESHVERETAPLGPQADPRTFLSDDDFPRWLRELAARETTCTVAEPGADPAASLSWPSWPGTMPASAGDGAATAPRVPVAPLSGGEPAPSPTLVPALSPAERAPVAIVARAREERRGRSAWETLLLILLVLGVLVAALWALVANGVFSPGL